MDFDVAVLNYVLLRVQDVHRRGDEALRFRRRSGLIGVIWRNIPMNQIYAAVNRMPQLELGYEPNYLAFRLHENPLLSSPPELPFQPDEEIVYTTTTPKLTNYLGRRVCCVVPVVCGGISSYVRSGCRLLLVLVFGLFFAVGNALYYIRTEALQKANKSSNTEATVRRASVLMPTAFLNFSTFQA